MGTVWAIGIPQKEGWYKSESPQRGKGVGDLTELFLLRIMNMSESPQRGKGVGDTLTIGPKLGLVM